MTKSHRIDRLGVATTFAWSPSKSSQLTSDMRRSARMVVGEKS